MIKSTSNARGAGPDVAKLKDFEDGKKTSADEGKRVDPAKQAAGGKGESNKMFGKQEAGPKKGGISGKLDDRGPGEPAAVGGKSHMHGFSGALPASPGRTAQLHNVDQAGREFKGPAAAFGRTEVAENIPSSGGSATKYAKPDKASSRSDSKMPDWHRTGARHVAHKGG